MKQGIFKIESNVSLTEDVMKMTLSGDTSAITAPGQFVNIKLDGFFLRRPISVCDLEGDTLTMIYKIVGRGTGAMASMTGGQLDVLTGLGNGYDMSCSGQEPLLIGGGAGVPPMYLLARKLLQQGKHPHVILGFNTASEVFYEEEFKALGAGVTVTTVDGSCGCLLYTSRAFKSAAGYHRLRRLHRRISLWCHNRRRKGRNPCGHGSHVRQRHSLF